MKKNKTDSVAKGGGSVASARIIGMAFSFLLFLLLARHSNEYAAQFRTVMTYIVVAEFLGMLGLHRWLATEIAPETKERWPLFIAINVFTLIVTTILALSYLLIANLEFYSAEYNQGIVWAALSVIPCGIYACVQCALIGIGRSHLMGKINLAENVIRCAIAILLVKINAPLIQIIWVFVGTRWLVAIYGFIQIKKIFSEDIGDSVWKIQPAIFKRITKEAPKFALIISGFLLLRNAGTLILPAMSTAAETALYAVCYQLLDLMLVVPSVLALTSINAFANKANASNAALKKVALQLIGITSIVMFPLITIAAAFGVQVLHLLYGDKYLQGYLALILMMVVTGLMVIDQGLSQIMQAKKIFKEDMYSILTGGFVALLFTAVLCGNYGAEGACFALILAMVATIIVRFFYLKGIFNFKLLWLSSWKPLLISIAVFVLATWALRLEVFKNIADSSFLWLFLAPVFLALYLLGVYLLGCFKKSQLYRMRQFLFHH